MNEKEIIERIWAEYYHAYDIVKYSSGITPDYLQASGHAQCALSLLALLRENTSQQHDDMASVMKKVLEKFCGHGVSI